MWHISIIIFIFGLTLAYFNIKFTYWKRKEVLMGQGRIPWGSFDNIQTESIADLLLKFHLQFQGARANYGGIYIFTTPVFLPVSPELIRYVLISDFTYFATRCSYHNIKEQNIGAHLYHMNGQIWRRLSTKVGSALLVAQKLKALIPVLVQSYIPLVGILEFYAEQKLSADAKILVENITRDAFTSIVLGMSPNEDLLRFEELLMDKSYAKQFLGKFKIAFPNITRRWNLLKCSRAAEDYFTTLVLKSIERRHKKSICHTDFMAFLMALYNHDHEHDLMLEEDKMSISEIIGQCFFFYTHGMQSSSHSLSFLLFELAKNQHVQTKVRHEIWQHIGRTESTWSYEKLADLKYLEQVINEILRKYPPIKYLERQCTRRYKIPHADKYIERDTTILISITGIHKNSAIYPEPEMFDPDRFADKQKDKLQRQCMYLAFGEGPRKCPGERFAVMQLKIALVSILQNFDIYLQPGSANPLKEGLLLKFNKVADTLIKQQRRASVLSSNCHL